MKFENIRALNFENAFRGMRNPKNSWHLIDSKFGLGLPADSFFCARDVGDYHISNRSSTGEFAHNSLTQESLLENGILYKSNGYEEYAFIGPKDMKLALGLIRGGSEHRKFLRQMVVSVDITAPLYWWKEFDTYKVGTVANSTSTMHKMLSKEITLDCFEIDDFNNIEYPELKNSDVVQTAIIPYLEYLRKLALELNGQEGKEKEFYKVWKELIRWLPEGWLQTRTVTMNYENLLAICSKSQRRFHKLTEWSGVDEVISTPSFIKFARSLPYSKYFIFFDELDK